MVTQIPDTPLNEIPAIHKTLTDTFRTGKLRPLSFRRAQLAQLAYLLQDNYLEFQDALFKDLGKHPVEAGVGEVGMMFQRTMDAINNLDKWNANVDLSSETHPMFAGFNPSLTKQPIGTVLIIGPFNGPVHLTIQPLIGAIAAGCPALIKPSELTVHTSSLICQLVHKYLDKDCYRAVFGGGEQATRLLEHKWGYICYIGGVNSGRLVAAAAAKYLTPVTLELGGKCPVVIDGDYDMELAGRRILWGKMTNAGQVCVAPDYVLVPRDRQDALVAGLQKAWHEFFPDGYLASPDTTNIVNERHYNRVRDMLKRTSGKVVLGGQLDPSRFKIDVTVVRDVQAGDSLLEDEIFGPILAIVPVDNTDAALDFIREYPEPLVVYLFSSNDSVKEYVRENTCSGGFMVNDTVFQISITQLPVSAIGASGYGYQGGKYAFDSFAHVRPSVDVPKEAEELLSIRYPPYTQNTYDVMNAGLFQPIPLPRAESVN